MNKVIIVGNLGWLGVRKDKDGNPYTDANGRHTMDGWLFANRPFTNKEGEREADKIRFTTHGASSAFLEGYCHVGDTLSVEGWLRTGSYQKADGTKVETWTVQVDSLERVKAAAPKGEAKTEAPAADGFANAEGSNIPDFA